MTDMRPLTLNFDILTYVVRYLSLREALSFSSVCKAVHSIVIRDVLSDVVLNSPKKVSKFPPFLLADYPRPRLPFLRKLTVESDAFHERYSILKIEDFVPMIRKFAAFLQHILTHSHHLRALSLPLSGEMFRQHTQLSAALIEYEGLAELTLLDVTEDVLQVVRNMHSSLRVLSIKYSVDSACFSSFFLSISTHQHLQKLCVFQVPRVESCFAYDVAQVNCPSVHHLEIWNSAPLASLVKAFPNVRTLYAGRLKTGVANADHCPQWVGLDYLHAVSHNVFHCNLRCPVRWLDLSPKTLDDEPARPRHDRIVETLERTRPQILTVGVRHDVAPNIWETLAPVPVKLLELMVRNEGLDSLKDQWIGTVPRTLHLLQVPCLSIRFESYDLFFTETGEILEIAEAFQGLQDVLAKSLPHLELLTVIVGPHCSRINRGLPANVPEKSAWWRIRHPDGDQKEPEAEPIPQWKGEQLWSRLHAMDYDSLSKLKPSDIAFD